MIKAFLQKAGKKLKRITGSNKKQDRSVSLPGQPQQEELQQGSLLSDDKGLNHNNLAKTGKQQE